MYERWQRTHFSWIEADTPFLPAVTQSIINVMDKGWEKKRMSQIPGVAEVLFKIRQRLCHAPIGFILEPKDFENHQFDVKSPHLVTLQHFCWQSPNLHEYIAPELFLLLMTSLFTFYHCLLSTIIFCRFHVIGVGSYPTFTLP